METVKTATVCATMFLLFGALVGLVCVGAAAMVGVDHPQPALVLGYIVALAYLASAWYRRN